MPSQIVIVGGGISGLGVLHALHQRFPENERPRLLLLEKNPVPGGTIRSEKTDEFLFENGPNGFLDSRPSTLQLIQELELESQLYPAASAAKKRFIKTQGRLHQLPSDPWSFLKFAPLTAGDKIRLFGEYFIKRGKNPFESVAEFSDRRLGKNVTRYLLDPMVSGIFAGDVEKLHLASAFPRIAALEQEYRSLFRALKHRRKQTKGKNSAAPGQPTGHLCSFVDGMGELIAALQNRYQDQIHCNEPVQAIVPEGTGYIITTSAAKYFADRLILSVPAYTAANLMLPINPRLAGFLDKIPYAPVVVVGVTYRRSAFGKKPDGFGYLIPSSEGSKVLGVLNTSNIFPNRAGTDSFLFRVMLGGRRHSEIIHAGRESWLQMARNEIESTYAVSEPPLQVQVAVWPRAIPQYETDYPDIKAGITQELQQHPGIYVAANYWGGVSVNDCTENAYLLVEKIAAE